ncbi:tubulin binding cofactor C-domain-containing protein [Phyllosticta capitalensis]|uniref:tubulin binding cofactor C-domain-containing protein n=1 Tax=Phyllosticta capitalensis TaxID=121624 RepID=UPI00312F39CF
MSTTLQPQPPSQGDLKERFFRYFTHEVTALDTQIEQLADKSVTGGERSDGVDHCLAGIARLSREVKDASAYIPAYDQRTYAEAIKALNDKLGQARASFAPRPKFSFKSTRKVATAVSHHKNPSAISLEDAAELASQARLKLPGASSSNASGKSSSGRGGLLDTAASSGTTTTNSSAYASPAVHTPAETEAGDDESRSAAGAAGASKSTTAEGEDAYVNRNLSSHERSRTPVRKPSFSGANSVTISGHTGLHIILPESASHATSSGTIANLRHCIVDMSMPTSTARAQQQQQQQSGDSGSSGLASNEAQPAAQAQGAAPFAALTLKNIKSSLVVCGRVSGAIHLTNLAHSVVVVSTRQFRMHECRGVAVYLACSSRPIIEDCVDVRFAPCPSLYSPPTSTSTSTPSTDPTPEAQPPPQQNLWDQVDDFKWLKAEPSPNWRALPPAERVADAVWRDLVPGGPELGVDDILKAVGVVPAKA